MRKQALFNRAYSKDTSDFYAINFHFFFIVKGKRLWIMGFQLQKIFSYQSSEAKTLILFFFWYYLLLATVRDKLLGKTGPCSDPAQPFLCSSSICPNRYLDIFLKVFICVWNCWKRIWNIIWTWGKKIRI